MEMLRRPLIIAARILSLIYKDQLAKSPVIKDISLQVKFVQVFIQKNYFPKLVLQDAQFVLLQLLTLAKAAYLAMY